MDPGPLLATTHDAGGLKVRLRLARPSDVVRVRAFLERRRPALAADASRFTFYDPRRRVALAATAPVDGSERIVGLVDFGVHERSRLVLADHREVAELLTAAARWLAARVRDAA